MDLCSVIGFVLGLICVLEFGIGLHNLELFIGEEALFIVIGGGSAATMIGLTMDDLKNSWRVYKKAFFNTPDDPVVLIKKIVEFAEIARRDGILALENVTDQIKDEFLVKGLQLAVDGTDPELIENILTTEIDCLKKRHNNGKGIIQAFEKYAPGFGMVGTLIGMIKMLSGGLNDPNVLTLGIAVALTTTFYGAMICNFFAGPFATKLAAINAHEMLVKSIVLKGVLSIQSGDNPRIVEMKLKVFLPPALRLFGKEVEN